MFTGIITDIGIVRAVEMRGDMRARIGCAYDMAGVDLGASIACDGVCLTVVAKGPDWFDVDISAETLSKTSIGAEGWSVGQRLNLERALRVGDELGGHIVSGHVDGVAQITAAAKDGDSLRLTFEAPARPGTLHRAEGVGHAERHLADRERGLWQQLRHQPDPAYPAGDHLGRCGGGRCREPGNRHAGPLCRAAGRSRTTDRRVTPA